MKVIGIHFSEEEFNLLEAALVVRLVHTHIEKGERVKTKKLLDDIRIIRKQVWKKKEA